MKKRSNSEISFGNLIDYASIADRVRLPGQSIPSFGDMGNEFDELFDDLVELSRLEALSYHTTLANQRAKTVLDCSCGTGIQAIGLAKLGYQVYASDISTKMLASTLEKAEKQGLDIVCRRADFRDLHPWKDKRFDAIISGGNSLCVLGELREIDRVLANAKSLLNPNGVVIIGCRDYKIPRDAGETILPRRSRIIDGNPEWIFDLRLFGSKRVKVIHFFLRISNGRWKIRSFVKSYLYLSANELADRMRKFYSKVENLDFMGLNPYTQGEWYLSVGYK